MIDRSTLLSKLKPYVGNATILKYDQGTGDIIKELLNSHLEYQKEYDRIYPYFMGRNVLETCKNIFNFLKKNVTYDIEPGSRQTLKSPSSILAQGYGDCKQYSQFIGGILDAIKRNKGGVEWCYRFASYNPQKQIQHVFVVAKDKQGNEIWIDPVLKTFNQKKDYTYKVDKKPNMALYKISGTDDQVGKFLPGLKKLSLKNVAKTVKKVAKVVAPVASIVVPAGLATKVGGKILKKVASKGIVKKIATKVAKSAPKVAKLKKAVNKVASVKKVVVKVDKTVARNAFLTLVSSNKGGIATKLGASFSAIKPGLFAQWQKLGGNTANLQSTILKGSRNAISGMDRYFYNSSIGAVVSAETIYSTALPVIETLKPILASVGIDVDKLVNTGTDEALNQVAQDIITTDETPQSVEEQPVIEPNEQGEAVAPVQSDVTTQNGVATLDIKSQGSADYTKFIVPAIAVAGIYFLTRKK